MILAKNGFELKLASKVSCSMLANPKENFLMLANLEIFVILAKIKFCSAPKKIYTRKVNILCSQIQKSFDVRKFFEFNARKKNFKSFKTDFFKADLFSNVTQTSFSRTTPNKPN